MSRPRHPLLAAYLAKQGNGASARLAKKMDIAAPMLSKLLTQRIKFSLALAMKMDHATGGELRAEALCPKYQDVIEHLRGTGPQQMNLPLKEAA